MLAIGMGCLLSMASIVPAFALENVVKDPAVKQLKIEAKQANQAERLLKRQERAAKLGVNIEGLSKEEAKAKVKEAATTKKEQRSVKLNEIATKLGIDIIGLTNKEAVAKIKEAKAIKQAIKTETQAAKIEKN
jgi:hypothetical protein